MVPKKPKVTSYRFSPEADALLEQISTKWGIRRADVIEWGIRLAAELIDAGVPALAEARTGAKAGSTWPLGITADATKHQVSRAGKTATIPADLWPTLVKLAEAHPKMVKTDDLRDIVPGTKLADVVTMLRELLAKLALTIRYHDHRYQLQEAE